MLEQQKLGWAGFSGHADRQVPGRTEATGCATAEAGAACFVVNGQPRKWRPDLTLEDVVANGDIEQLGASRACEQDACIRPVDEGAIAARLESAAWATSLNARFVARERRGQAFISPGDVVLVFQPIVGG